MFSVLPDYALFNLPGIFKRKTQTGYQFCLSNLRNVVGISDLG